MKLGWQNRYGIYLLLILLGTLILFANSKFTLGIIGLLPLSVLLLTLPVILMIFSEENNKITKVGCLILLFFPLILINFIYYIQVSFPVGFQDVHDHIYLYNHLFSNGKILFNNAQAISYNFVGLYIHTYFIQLISNLDIILLASIIPPIINIIMTFTIYLFINRLFSHKIAIVATLIIGWTDSFLLFGHEFRPQTLGTLFLFEILLIIAIFYSKKEKTTSKKLIILLLLIIALTTTSFVSWLYCLIIFIILLVTSIILTRKWNILIPPILVFLFFVFFIFYMIYIGISFNNIAPFLIYLINQIFSKSVISAPQTGQLIYGDFAQWFTYCVWGIFVIGSIYYLRDIFLRKMDILRISFFLSFSGLFIFGLFNAAVGIGLLNIERIYIVAIILIGTVIAYNIYKNFSKFKKRRHKIFIIGIISLFIILYISTSLVKFPNYIIGETKPIRGETEIDQYNYWYLGNIDYAASGFMKSTVFSKTIHSHMLITNYMVLQLYDQNNHPGKSSIDYNGHILYQYIHKYDLILLQNKEQNRDYANRNLLPPQNAYKDFNSFYTNGDYILYGG